jgi:hypothetical protein
MAGGVPSGGLRRPSAIASTRVLAQSAGPWSGGGRSGNLLRRSPPLARLLARPGIPGQVYDLSLRNAGPSGDGQPPAARRSLPAHGPASKLLHDVSLPPTTQAGEAYLGCLGMVQVGHAGRPGARRSAISAGQRAASGRTTGPATPAWGRRRKGSCLDAGLASAAAIGSQALLSPTARRPRPGRAGQRAAICRRQ